MPMFVVLHPDIPREGIKYTIPRASKYFTILSLGSAVLDERISIMAKI